MHAMDKSLFVERLSVEDNRNVKKLYAIADLARTKHTIKSLLQTLDESYAKLLQFHRKRALAPRPIDKRRAGRFSEDTQNSSYPHWRQEIYDN